MRTLAFAQSIPHASYTIPELRLRGFELLKGGREVLELLRELVFDLVQLANGQGGEVDW